MRVAMVSVHTSPLAQPGGGDAGGMNVYVDELATALVQRGVHVEVLTRRDRSDLPNEVEARGGYLVRHIDTGPYGEITKEDLPGQLCSFTAATLRLEATHPPDWFDVVHSHYWLSGQVGFVVADRWNVPLVHSMHTLAKSKNRTLAPGDTPESTLRIMGEEAVVRAARHLVTNTDAEGEDLIRDYGADPARVTTIMPGVDLDTFRPGSKVEARRSLGIDEREPLCVFAGRIQMLKGPDIIIRAIAANRSRGLITPRLVVIGGPSGRPTAVTELQALAHYLGVADLVSFVEPQPRDVLAHWLRAADVVTVPSRSETFGFVAAEAQACGTTVIAADVGGLRSIIEHEQTGLLVPSHVPHAWGDALAEAFADDSRRITWGDAAAMRAADIFRWDRAAEEFMSVYQMSYASTP